MSNVEDRLDQMVEDVENLRTRVYTIEVRVGIKSPTGTETRLDRRVDNIEDHLGIENLQLTSGGLQAEVAELRAELEELKDALSGG